METSREHNNLSKTIHIGGNPFSHMKCIKCPQCGEEILMVPTLGKMIEAIENHINLHKKLPSEDIPVSCPEVPSIRTDLTEQVLRHAADTIDTRYRSSPWL